MKFSYIEALPNSMYFEFFSLFDKETQLVLRLTSLPNGILVYLIKQLCSVVNLCKQLGYSGTSQFLG